jgi:hypothetical protein
VVLRASASLAPLASARRTKRSIEEAGFLRSIDMAMDRFHQKILQVLKIDTRR